VIGLARQDCGPFFDDVEISRAWVVNPDGTDTAPADARFVRGAPQATTWNGYRIQPAATTSGRYAFVTGRPAGPTPNTHDLDGRTTIRSVPIALPATPGNLTFRYVFAHGPGSSDDSLRVWVEDDTGTRTQVWWVSGSPRTIRATWRVASASLAPWAGKSVRIVIVATDGGRNTLVEALVDDIRVERPS
jgi:aminopeptidase S